MTQPLQIFISYKRENQSFAEELREQLIAWGYRTWMDIYDIPKGAYWPDEIDAGLQASDVVIGVMSPQAIQSRNVKNEWDWAIVNGRRLIPVMLESCVVPMNYVSINYIDFTKDKRRGFDNLRAALEQPHSPSAPAAPYRPYLEKLYERINTYLAQKILPTLRDDKDRPEPIRLRSEATPNAVLFEKRQEIDPLFAIGGIQSGTVSEGEQVYDDFERAFNRYDGRVLLLGEPGAGKTITLLHFGRDAVVRRIQDPTQPLPILLIVPTWDAEKHKTFTDWVTQSYEPPENAAELIERGETLLLLDGLDELDGERSIYGEKYDLRLRFIHLIPANNKILVTCRVKDYEDIGEKINLKGAVTLKPLDDAQLRAYLAKQPELMVAIETDDRLREMLSTPLLLSFFAFAYQGMTEAERQQLSDLSKSPGDLRDAIFRKYVEERYEHERRKPNAKLPYTVEEMYQVLGRVAFEDIRRFFYEQNRISVSEIEGVNDTDAFIEQGCKLHILIREDDTLVRFIHLRLRDHFAYRTAVVSLHDKNRYVRAWAVEALGIIGDARAVEPLIARLDDSADDVRARAVWALPKIGQPAVELLITALSDSGELVRKNAAEALGRIGDERAVEPLIARLNDSADDVRAWAAEALGRIGDARAVEPLIARLDVSHDNVRAWAAGALGRIGDERAVEPLIARLDDSADDVRSRAAEALGRIGDARAVEPLIARLDDSADHVRVWAVEALGRIGDARAVEPLIARLDDSADDVRAWAAQALGRIEDARAVEPLIARLDDSADDVRAWAAGALSRIGDERAVEPLIARLDDGGEGVRGLAAEALGIIGDERAVEPLIARLDDSDEFVRAVAAGALGIIGDERAVEPLIARLDDSDDHVRTWAAEALGIIGDERAVEPLIARLDDSADDVRAGAAEALGRIGDERAVEPLIARLDVSHDNVRAWAAEALELIGTPEALAAVKEWRKQQGE